MGKITHANGHLGREATHSPEGKPLGPVALPSWHSHCEDNATMQTPYSDLRNPTTFFSRERRKERMLKFLEAFERRSWRCAGEFPFLVPLAKEELREQPAGYARENRD